VVLERKLWGHTEEIVVLERKLFGREQCGCRDVHI